MDRPNPLVLTGAKRVWAFARALAAQAKVMRKMGEALNTPGFTLAERHFTNPALVDFFGRFGYRGASAASTAGAWATWIYDYWYPLGGLQAFADLLARSYLAHGGELRYRTQVTRVEVDEAGAAGVTTAEGETLPARFVVSAGDYRRLIQQQLPEGAVPPSHAAETAATPVSDAIFSVYLGLDLPPATLASLMQTHHVFVQPGVVPLPEGERDQNWHASRWVELSSPSLADPSLAPGGCSSLILQIMSSYAWMNRWGTAEGGRRTAEYRALKELVTQQAISTAERVITGLSEHIVFREAATPLTHERYTLNSEGATAGWTWDPLRTPIKSATGRFTTPVPGLYQVGHWTNRIGGVPAAALSARLVADLIGREAR
jgi:prolycopene isomerase